MPRSKHQRTTRVFIRQWLAELFDVSVESVSRWVSLGHLRSYAPADVKEFLTRNPRALNPTSRVRRLRSDKGVPRTPRAVPKGARGGAPARTASARRRRAGGSGPAAKPPAARRAVKSAPRAPRVRRSARP